MRVHRDGLTLRDDQGRQLLYRGINLVAKGKPGAIAGDPVFRGEWTSDDLTELADEHGINLVRLGVIWAAAAPQPHTWHEGYLSWIGEQLDLCHRAGIAVILDGHQDLYSQQFGDGAPAWATLTDQRFEAADLWSQGYLNSAAVQQSLDAFWTNTPVAGLGLQDHLIALWVQVLRRHGDHPALLGVDPLNEPAPGSFAGEFAGQLLGGLAQLTGQPVEQVLAQFDDPSTKLAQLAHLDRVELHRELGDHLAPTLAGFEQTVQEFYDRTWAALRTTGYEGLLLREHSYFGNVGVPVLADAAGEQVVYSPHGYDLVVDTEATRLASNTRAETIFTRCRENQLRWQLPVIVGEWGAFGLMDQVGRHGNHLLDLFDRFGWSHCYWCWEPGFSRSEAGRLLQRPQPQAVDGTLTEYGTGPDGAFRAS